MRCRPTTRFNGYTLRVDGSTLYVDPRLPTLAFASTETATAATAIFKDGQPQLSPFPHQPANSPDFHASPALNASHSFSHFLLEDSNGTDLMGMLDAGATQRKQLVAA